MWNLKNNINELTHKTETDSQTWGKKAKNLWLPKGREGEVKNWDHENNRNILLYINQINKDLLYSTENYIQFLVITYNGKESEDYIDLYIYP